MTCIVSPAAYPSKKALREAVAANPDGVWITDPSIIQPRQFCAGILRIGESVTVTNHPKRSWFAKIERTKTGFKVL